MQTIDECRLLGSRSEGARRAALLEAEDALAEARLERWRLQHRTISDRDQPVPARAPAPVRRLARREARQVKGRPVVGQLEYRRGGTFTIEERPC